MKETVAKINKAKSCFFEKINKIYKPFSRLIKKKREKNQINKILNEKGEVTVDNVKIQKIIRDYYENYVAIKWITWNRQILSKVQSSNTEQGRNRNYKQPNYKH